MRDLRHLLHYTFTFNQINTGEVDGFAVVGVIVDGTVRVEERFFVPRGPGVSEFMTTTVNDCNAHSSDVMITSVFKE